MSMNTARDRAEELFGNLQKKARDLLDAEEGLTHTVRDMIEDAGLNPNEVRRRLEELVGRIKANKLWDRVSNDTVIALGDYRDELERRVGGIMGNLPVVPKQDFDDLVERVQSLELRLENLGELLESTKNQ